MTTTVELETLEVEVDPVMAACVDQTCAPDPRSIEAAMGSAFATLGGYMRERNLQPIGPPRAIYTAVGAPQMTFTLAFPVANALASAAVGAGARTAMLRGGRALRITHHGPYADLHATYGRIESWLRARGGMRGPEDWSRYSPMWEEYVVDPSTVPASELLTYIYLPLGWNPAGARTNR